MGIGAYGGWSAVLGRLSERTDLDRSEARDCMATILGGDATNAQIAAFIVALRLKGETVEELAGMVEAMLAAAEPLEVPAGAIDIVGAGGGGSRRSAAVNVSTMASIVAAGAGATVCKHGNRRASSTSGSFDLLEELGVAIEIPPRALEACVRDVGIGFAFARSFHSAMRHAAPVRTELGIPTVFNFLGPLSNPGHVRRQLIGVSDPRLARHMIEVLRDQGSVRAMIVHGHDGLDELSTTGPSQVLELRDGEIVEKVVDPVSLGVEVVTIDDLRGGDPAVNAVLARRVLAGEKSPYRDIVVLNAAGGLVVAGLVDDLAAGIERAATAIDDGSAAAVLAKLVEVTTRLAA